MATNQYIVLLALFTSACSGSPTSPTAPVMRVTPVRPLVVAGQSNARNLAPALQAVYPLPVLADSTQNGAAIENWAETTHPQVLWPLLAQDVASGPQAIVWWQGESDRENPQYADDLRHWVQRVRSLSDAPLLLVRVLPRLENARVRAAQAAIASEFGLPLLSCDDLPTDGSDHLTSDGYGRMAQRVLDALP